MNVCLTIPFPSSEIASLVYDVLSVDKDLKRSKVQRILQLEDKNLTVTFISEEPKGLRVAANAFMKNVKLIVKTMMMFQPAPEEIQQNA